MVSLRDIAQHCGVSVATVSKALNSRPDIGEETRKRVCAAARELGYTTNSAARALKTNRTYNLGVLFVDERQSGLAHEYFSTVLESFKATAEEQGYDITFINHNVGGKRTSYLQHCLYRGVDGVVIACVDFFDAQVTELVNSGIPVVTIDHVFNNRTAVLSDNVDGIDTLVRYVFAKGHRKIALIHGENTAVTENRLISFQRTCAELGLEVEEPYIRGSYYHDSEGCRKVTQELLTLPERPTCILFPDDISYLGGLNAILDAGLRVPQDISAVGYDGIKLSRVLTPSLTTYHQDAKTLGQEAARLLIQQIERPKTTLPQQVLIPGWLMEGQSVADIHM